MVCNGVVVIAVVVAEIDDVVDVVVPFVVAVVLVVGVAVVIAGAVECYCFSITNIGGERHRKPIICIHQMTVVELCIWPR